MNYIKYILGLSVISVLCYGCSEDLFTQVVEINIPEHESGISIGADFLQSYNDVVRLQASKGIREGGDLEEIVGATVVLKQGDTVIKTYKEEVINGFDRPGYYTNAQTMELDPGVAYTLEVEKEGFEKASSTQVMPPRVEITDAQYVEEGYAERDGFRTDKISISFTDPVGEENYYAIQVRLYYVDFDSTESSYHLNIFNDIDPILEEGYEQEIVLNDGAIDGRSVTFDFGLGVQLKDAFRETERLGIELYSICLLYTSPSPRDRTRSRMTSSA